VTYQCQYFTIHSSISECDHKCETRNTEPEIGTDGSSQTRRNLRVDRYGSGFGPRRVSGSGFCKGLEPYRTYPFFRSKPGPVVGYPDPVLTLLMLPLCSHQNPQSVIRVHRDSRRDLARCSGCDPPDCVRPRRQLS
jgi:hypothetical protein